MSKFKVPASLDRAKADLVGLDSLVTASEWQRAAIVFAFTDVTNKGGRGNRASSSTVLGIRGFAELGITGLKSTDSVRRYRNAWQSAIDAGHVRAVQPGDLVVLPDMAFPLYVEIVDDDRRNALTSAAEAEGAGPSMTHKIATHLPALRAAIKADPKVAAEAMKALDDRYEAAPKPSPVASHNTGAQPIELVYEFRRLHRSVDAIISMVVDGRAIVSDAQRDAVLREVQWLTMALGYIESGVQANSLDAALAELLDAEA